MGEDKNKTKTKTEYFYCPCCGLRRPKSKMLGYYGIYCPFCGSKMIEEGSIPYRSKSRLHSKNNSKDKSKEEGMLNRFNSLNRSKQDTTLKKDFQTYNNSNRIDNSVIENYKFEIKELTKIIRLNPGDFRLYFDRATLKLRTGDIEGARADFRMAENYHCQTNFEFEDFPLL